MEQQLKAQLGVPALSGSPLREVQQGLAVAPHTNVRLHASCSHVYVQRIAGGCSWFGGDGSSITPPGNTDTCAKCQAACAPSPVCFFYSWSGGRMALYNDTSVCGGGGGGAAAPTPTPVPASMGEAWVTICRLSQLFAFDRCYSPFLIGLRCTCRST